MRIITLRELLRNIKSILPVPKEGVQVKRRDGEDFYIYPEPSKKAPIPMTDADVEKVAESVAHKVNEERDRNSTTQS